MINDESEEDDKAAENGETDNENEKDETASVMNTKN